MRVHPRDPRAQRPLRATAHLRARGFTLLELLIVITLIGLVMAVTVASFGNRDGAAAVAGEAQQLAALIELARERAETSSEEWGIDFEPTGYTFLTYDVRTRRWRESADARFRACTLADTLALGVDVDARDVLSEGKGKARSGRSRKATEDRVPDVLLLSSGETSQFTVRLSRNDDPAVAWELRTDGIAMVRATALAAAR